MKKYGKFTKAEKDELCDTLAKYWKKYKHSFHPSFLCGAEYILKHLNIIDDFERPVTTAEFEELKYRDQSAYLQARFELFLSHKINPIVSIDNSEDQKEYEFWIDNMKQCVTYMLKEQLELINENKNS